MKTTRPKAQISRPRLKRRRTVRRRLLAFCLVAALIGLFVFLFRQAGGRGPLPTLFAISRVDCNDRLFDPSFLYGRNLLSVSPAEIAARAAETPQLGRISIRRIFPDRLEISIVRRTPFAHFTARDGSTRFLDPEGIVLREEALDPDIPATLKIINLAEAQLPEVGAEIYRFSRDFAFTEPAAVRVDADFLTIFTRENGEIRVPRPAARADREILARVLADFETKNVTYRYIDLRFGAPFFLPGTAVPVMPGPGRGDDG